MPSVRRKVPRPESGTGCSQWLQPRPSAGLFRCGVAVGLLLAWSLPAAAWQCEARVDRVHDADTLSLRCPERRFKLRLSGVDAPELSQPSGREARAALQTHLSGRAVQVSSRATDVYGRIVGEVSVEGISLAIWLVDRGWAWCAPRASLACRQRQAIARTAQRGLWVDADAVAPWVWRDRQQGPSPEAPPIRSR